MSIEGTNIRCDSQCCKYHKKLGEVHTIGGSITVVSRSHGTHHVGSVLLIDLVSSIIGTLSAGAIQDWIEKNNTR
jgi:hypothetical protein